MSTCVILVDIMVFPVPESTLWWGPMQARGVHTRPPSSEPTNQPGSGHWSLSMPIGQWSQPVVTVGAQWSMVPTSGHSQCPMVNGSNQWSLSVPTGQWSHPVVTLSAQWSMVPTSGHSGCPMVPTSGHCRCPPVNGSKQWSLYIVTGSQPCTGYSQIQK